MPGIFGPPGEVPEMYDVRLGWYTRHPADRETEPERAAHTRRLFRQDVDLELERTDEDFFAAWEQFEETGSTTDLIEAVRIGGRYLRKLEFFGRLGERDLLELSRPLRAAAERLLDKVFERLARQIEAGDLTEEELLQGFGDYPLPGMTLQ